MDSVGGACCGCASIRGCARLSCVHYHAPTTQHAIWSKTPGVDRHVYGPYLLLLPPEKLAVITISEALNMTMYQVGVCMCGLAVASPSLLAAAPSVSHALCDGAQAVVGAVVGGVMMSGGLARVVPSVMYC